MSGSRDKAVVKSNAALCPVLGRRVRRIRAASPKKLGKILGPAGSLPYALLLLILVAIRPNLDTASLWVNHRSQIFKQIGEFDAEII